MNGTNGLIKPTKLLVNSFEMRQSVSLRSCVTRRLRTLTACKIHEKMASQEIIQLMCQHSSMCRG